MEGKGIGWSRELLLGIGEALVVLDLIEDRGLKPGDIDLLRRILFEVYCSIESPDVSYEDLRELFE